MAVAIESAIVATVARSTSVLHLALPKRLGQSQKAKAES